MPSVANCRQCASFTCVLQQFPEWVRKRLKLGTFNLIGAARCANTLLPLTTNLMEQAMAEKKCTKCGGVKPLSEFRGRSSSKDGKFPQCKACEREYQRKYYQASRDNHEYREANKERSREWRKANKNKIAQYSREHYQTNSHHKREYQRKYREANKAAERRYFRERYISDSMFALKQRCRTRVRNALKGHGFSKKATTKDLLGCGYEKLVQHLESQFTDGMSWANRSEWHIDHIVPLASAKTEGELLALCHYTNLQPLWAKDNMSKGARLCET